MSDGNNVTISRDYLRRLEAAHLYVQAVIISERGALMPVTLASTLTFYKHLSECWEKNQPLDKVKLTVELGEEMP